MTVQEEMNNPKEQELCLNGEEHTGATHVLLRWPAVSEVDVSGMPIEVEPSHQYPVTFCCHVTHDSRGAL